MSFKDWFRAPSAKRIAQHDLEEAQRRLLVWHSQAEYSQQMVVYYQRMVERLKKYTCGDEQEVESGGTPCTIGGILPAKDGTVTPKPLSPQALSIRLAEHAGGKPDGSSIGDDLVLASKTITELLQNYNSACRLLAEMNEAVLGTPVGEVVGPTKAAHEAYVDSKRYHWLRRNIARLVLDTTPHYSEDGGVVTTINAITVRPDLRGNTDTEFFDKLVDLMMEDHND